MNKDTNDIRHFYEGAVRFLQELYCPFWNQKPEK
jgi:hypothetical protein